MDGNDVKWFVFARIEGSEVETIEFALKTHDPVSSVLEFIETVRSARYFQVIERYGEEYVIMDV